LDITFPDIYAIDPETFGILFPVDVDGKRIKCLVDTDALQDIDPSNAGDTAKNQFNSNKYSFQSIAKGKILNGEGVNGQIFIQYKDILKFHA